MDLALNNQQRLICHKSNPPKKQPTSVLDMTLNITMVMFKTVSFPSPLDFNLYIMTNLHHLRNELEHFRCLLYGTIIQMQ